MKIVPSLLAEDFDDFVDRLRKAEKFADYVQIDLMDGDFVPTKSFPPERLNSIETSLAFEVHLMVRDPLPHIEGIKHPGLRRIIFHVEADGNHAEAVASIQERGLSAGLAIKPETAIEDVRMALECADTLLFLTVDPCCYGSPFKSEVLEKIAEARPMFPGRTITVDGGVSLDNLNAFHDLGVDSACVGSRIFLTENPEESYRAFVKRARELGAD
ncbi:MAG: ribulose-phosphate 3-epimerase [Chloroflexota bacterium]